MVLVVRAVHDSRDAANGTSTALGDERRDGAVAALEGRVRREKLRDATGKRRDVSRIRFVNDFRRSLEPLPLRRSLANENRKCFCGVLD